MKKITVILSMFFVVILGGYNAALALPISVEYTYTEQLAGYYQFDFTVSNNIDASWGQHIYYFGLDIVSFVPSQISSPTDWNKFTDTFTWDLTTGDSVVKKISFTTTSPSLDPIASGESLSGFSIPWVIGIPTTIDFVVLTSSSYNPIDSELWFKNYTAGDDNVDRKYFYADWNVGFAGSAQLYSPDDPGTTPVPEPSTFLLLGGGLAGLAFVVRRRKKE